MRFIHLVEKNLEVDLKTFSKHCEILSNEMSISIGYIKKNSIEFIFIGKYFNIDKRLTEVKYKFK